MFNPAKQNVTRPYITKHNQSGAVLVVSLIILLVLTILALTSMQNTVFEEKMASAVRDSRVALEGTEATLREVETSVIGPLATTADFDNSGCLYAAGAAPDPNDVSIWSTTETCTADTVNVRQTGETGAEGGLAEAPRYFVELLGEITSPSVTEAMICNYGCGTGEGAVTGFRVIAQSTGSTGTSVKMIGAYYGKRL